MICKHCERAVVFDPEEGVWVDPNASGDDAVWREVCDQHDSFRANHQPKEG